ncbi:MAG: hypothetical protein MZU97_20000 [Bacillus subtilis]|nr:hypothetical protein [Bacillus subtilis]
MMGGGAGGGANWWWDSWIHPANAYYIYQGAAAFADKLDLSGDYRLLSQIGIQVGNPALKALGYAVDNRIYAYFYGSGQTTFQAPLANGTYTVAFYSTTTGALLSQSTTSVTGGILQVNVSAFVKDVAMIVQSHSG